MNINGKRIVVTGAASGIGLEVVKRLAQYPCQIVAADLNVSGLEALNIDRVIRYQIDLSTQAANNQLFDFAIEKLGGIDIYFANAGFAYYEKLADADWHHIEKIFNVNVFTPFYVAQKMFDLNPENPYKVIITASAMAHLALPGYSLYSATKAAIHRFAQAYRFEMPAHGQLMIVYPIATRTNFFKRASDNTPIPFPSHTPEYVAAHIVRGIERDSNAVYPSVIFRVFSLASRVLPFLAPLMQSYEKWRFQKWLRTRD